MRVLLMPNHVTNQVTAQKSVIDALLSDDGQVDFEKLIPMPQLLKDCGNGIPYIKPELVFLAEYVQQKTGFTAILASDCIGGQELVHLSHADNMPLTKEEVMNLVDDAKDYIQERYERLLKRKVQLDINSIVYQAFCLTQVSSTDCLSWAREHWGTKWNGYNTEELSDNCIRFQTAWSFPEPILVALSQKFPNDEIEVSYADEDLGNNCGYFTLKNGVVIAGRNAHNDSEENWRDFASKLIYGCDYEGFYNE